jgi:hypothetical protein
MQIVFTYGQVREMEVAALRRLLRGGKTSCPIPRDYFRVWNRGRGWVHNLASKHASWILGDKRQADD